MTVFWLHGEELMFGGSVHPVQPRIPQMKMMKVHIPFTFKLQETSKSSYSGRDIFIISVKMLTCGVEDQMIQSERFVTFSMRNSFFKVVARIKIVNLIIITTHV